MGHGTSITRHSPRTRGTSLVLGLVMVAALAGTSSAQAAAPGNGRANGGPWVNRTLTGGVARDLSIQELTAVNRAVGIQFPLR